MVSIKNVYKRFGDKRVFENFSLEISSGGIVGLLGENGIGKTTLLRMIADLAKPNSGEVMVNGQAVSRHTRDMVSFLLEEKQFSDARNYVRVKDAIQEYHEFYPDFDLAKAERMCTDFQLNPNDKISKLSKGQKGRICLILCLARNAQLYVLDEPMSGFDPKFKKDMVATIATHIGEGHTMIISSHLLRDLETIFDEVIVLTHNQATAAKADDIRAEGRSIEDFYMEVVENENN